MRRPAALAGLVLLPALLAAAPPGHGANASVTVANFSFSPATVTVLAGESVTWFWSSGTHSVHQDVTNAEWCSVRNAPGPSCTRTFPTAGSFAYHCVVHPSMRATVSVVDANAPDLVVDSLTVADTGSSQKTLTAVVRNQGVDDAGASVLRLTYQGLGALGTRTIGTPATPAIAGTGSVAGGGTATVVQTWDTTTKLGDFTLTATADANGQVAELSEANNARTATTSVRLSGVPGVG